MTKLKESLVVVWDIPRTNFVLCLLRRNFSLHSLTLLDTDCAGFAVGASPAVSEDQGPETSEASVNLSKRQLMKPQNSGRKQFQRGWQKDQFVAVCCTTACLPPAMAMSSFLSKRDRQLRSKHKSLQMQAAKRKQGEASSRIERDAKRKNRWKLAAKRSQN